jgi:hypothetical protein
VVSRGLATLHELDTVLSTEDLYDLIEIMAVDAYNQRVILNTPPRN